MKFTVEAEIKAFCEKCNTELVLYEKKIGELAIESCKTCKRTEQENSE